MKTNIFKRCTSLVLALIISISSFAGLATTAFAAGVKGKSYMRDSNSELMAKFYLFSSVFLQVRILRQQTEV